MAIRRCVAIEDVLKFAKKTKYSGGKFSTMILNWPLQEYLVEVSAAAEL